jgi:hypothetical protein
VGKKYKYNNVKFDSSVDLSSYYEFIDSCRSKVYSENTHKHHIIPLFMGGDKKSISNIINLSCEDHIDAHYKLAKCFNSSRREYIGNMAAAHIISATRFNEYYTKNKSYLKGIKRPEHSKYMKEKILSGKYSISFLGKKHKNTTRELMSISAKKSWTLERKNNYKNKWGGDNSPYAKLYKGEGNPNSKSYKDTLTNKIYNTVDELCYELKLSQYMWLKLKNSNRFILIKSGRC